MDRKKILVVDDEESLVRIVRLRLEAEQYEVVTAYDGEDALRKAKEDKPDLILLDLMLPKMDGFWVCGLLKKDRRFKNIPVIIFSGRSQEDDIKFSQKVGADAYIIKPFEPQLLLDKIKELIMVAG
jgi:DNA-binding response OmpR family regulator